MRWTIPAAALLAAAALAGCGGQETERAAAPDQTRAADTAAHGAGMQMSGDMLRDMPMMNERMMAAIGPADSAYDLRWMNVMIEHHRGAVMMARDALSKSQHPELREMARRMAEQQDEEIRRLQTLRQQWYGQ